MTSGMAPSSAANVVISDRPEPLATGFEDGALRRHPALALRFEREIDQHDAILLDDADQQNDADEGDQRKIGIRQVAKRGARPDLPTARWK